MSAALVAFVAQAEVAVVGGDLDRRLELLAVGDAERQVPRSAAARRPRRRTTTGGGTRTRPRAFGGSDSRKASSRARSFFRVGGSWNSSAPSLSPERAGHAAERLASGPRSRSSLASWVMRRGAFSVKREVLRAPARPSRRQQLLGRHPVEGVVDLDRREIARRSRAASSRPQDRPDRSCPSTRDSCSRKCRRRSLRRFYQRGSRRPPPPPPPRGRRRRPAAAEPPPGPRPPPAGFGCASLTTIARPSISR